jgi:hypothetical protein
MGQKLVRILEGSIYIGELRKKKEHDILVISLYERTYEWQKLHPIILKKHRARWRSFWQSIKISL